MTLIALDWGTTSLRAYRRDAAGNIVERRAGGPGIMRVDNGAFEVALPVLFGVFLLPGEPNMGANVALTGHLIFLLTNQIGLVFFLRKLRN